MTISHRSILWGKDRRKKWKNKIKIEKNIIMALFGCKYIDFLCVLTSFFLQILRAWTLIPLLGGRRSSGLYSISLLCFCDFHETEESLESGSVILETNDGAYALSLLRMSSCFDLFRIGLFFLRKASKGVVANTTYAEKTVCIWECLPSQMHTVFLTSIPANVQPSAKDKKATNLLVAEISLRQKSHPVTTP